MRDWFLTRTCERFPYPADSLASGGYSEFCTTGPNLWFWLLVFTVLLTIFLTGVVIGDQHGTKATERRWSEAVAHAEGHRRALSKNSGEQG
jgi:cytochrome b subunit of formate dehydrogenase